MSTVSGLSVRPLPRTVEQIDAPWLTSALRRRFPDLTVERVEVVEAIFGTATKVRIRAEYSGAPEIGGPPSDLCVKGGFDRRMRVRATNKLVKRMGLLDSSRAFQLEAGFYNELAPTMATRLPQCWFAASAPEEHQGVIVLDDLVTAGVTFGEPTVPYSVDLVAEALEVQAAWHAATWDLPRRAQPWIPPGSIIADLTPLLLSKFHWNTHFRMRQAPKLPPELQDRRRLLDGLKRMWSVYARETRCLSHGDPHIGNTFVDRDGHPTYFDWQSICFGAPLDDVSYFITGALTVDDRRANERDLLRHYLAALAAGGGASGCRISEDQAWEMYRRYSLHGFLWVTTPPVMQTWERVRAMSERHIAAILDLDALGALESIAPAVPIAP